MTLVLALANGLALKKLLKFIQNFELFKSSKILFLGCLWVCERPRVASNLIQILPTLALASCSRVKLNASHTIVHFHSQWEQIVYLRSFCDKMVKGRQLLTLFA